MSDDKLNEALKQQLQALNALFLAKLPEKIIDIENAWTQCERESSNREYWEKLHRLLHTLAGSSGSFGFAEIGLRARAIEHSINTLLASQDSETEPRKIALKENVGDFCQWVIKSAAASLPK